MSELIQAIAIIDSKEVKKSLVKGSSYYFFVDEKHTKFIDSGDMVNGMSLYVPVKSEIEEAYDRGEVIQYKATDVDYWTDFVPVSDTDMPTYSYKLEWRVKNE